MFGIFYRKHTAELNRCKTEVSSLKASNQKKDEQLAVYIKVIDNKTAELAKYKTDNYTLIARIVAIETQVNSDLELQRQHIQQLEAKLKEKKAKSKKSKGKKKSK